MKSDRGNVDFIIRLTGKWKGEIPIEKMLWLLESIKSAFNEVIEVKKEKLKKKIPSPRLIVANLDKGSVSVGFRVEPKEEQRFFKEENYSWVIDEMVSAYDAIVHPEKQIMENRRIVEKFLPLEKCLKNGDFTGLQMKCPGKRWRRELRLENFAKIRAELKKVPSLRKLELIGKLVEVDVRRSKEKCMLITTFGDRIKCAYPPELEEEICEHLLPLNRNVDIKGKAEIDPETDVIKLFYIEEIKSEYDFFQEKLKSEEATDFEPYVGLLADIPGDADEITDWMIQTLWGK